MGEGNSIISPNPPNPSSGGGGWISQTNTTYNGDDSAAQVGTVRLDETSCMETTLEGDKVVRFYWKVNGDITANLSFLINDVSHIFIKNILNWHSQVLPLKDGDNLKWCYYIRDNLKGGHRSLSDYNGWVDSLELRDRVLLAEALDNTNYIFTSSGDADWVGQTFVAKVGGRAAQTGIVSDNEESCLHTSVEVGGGMTKTISFDWKIRGENRELGVLGFIAIVFYINDSRAGNDTMGRPGLLINFSNWESRTYSLNAGNNALKWC